MRKCIQIVEDDEGIRSCVQFILEDADYIVEAFENAKSFVNRLDNRHVDLIILDVMLPDGNGIDLCKQLKQDQTSVDIPVIIMSAHARSESILQESCAIDFISKPFDIDQFVSKVAQHITCD